MEEFESEESYFLSVGCCGDGDCIVVCGEVLLESSKDCLRERTTDPAATRVRGDFFFYCCCFFLSGLPPASLAVSSMVLAYFFMSASCEILEVRIAFKSASLLSLLVQLLIKYSVSSNSFSSSSFSMQPKIAMPTRYNTTSPWVSIRSQIFLQREPSVRVCNAHARKLTAYPTRGKGKARQKRVKNHSTRKISELIECRCRCLITAGYLCERK